MNPVITDSTEKAAVAAFNKQAPVFDQLYGSDPIIQYKRKRVRDHVESFIPPHSQILELNAGTGEDAVYFAKQGHRVHATDISTAMLEKLGEKAREQQADDAISSEQCSFNSLENLQQKGPYDLVFSNFAGLNCTNQLDKVLDSLPPLVKPGGFITLVILPKFCLWEFLMLFKGKFRTAFRRFTGKKGVRAHIEGEHFRCWHYNPSYVSKRLKDSFKVVALEGLCTFVPPSYIQDFATRYPKWFTRLRKREDSSKGKWPWRGIGDYYIITLQKK